MGWRGILILFALVAGLGVVLLLTDESTPVAQKYCHGWFTPSSAPRTRRMSSAGTIVRKMPANTAATSTIG